jgi:hypothetical protein
MLDGKLELGIMTGGYYCSQEWTYYPLVEVPAHGRLIDADEFFEALTMDDRVTICEAIHVQSILSDAPTIIPASGKEQI